MCYLHRIENYLNNRLSGLKDMYYHMNSLMGWTLKTAGIHGGARNTKVYLHKPHQNVKKYMQMGTLFAFGQQDPNSDPDIPVSNQTPPVALWKGIQMSWGTCPQQLGLSYKNPLPRKV